MTATQPLAADSPASQEALKRLGDAGASPGRAAEVVARMADFLQLSPAAARGAGMPLDFLLDVALPVQAELGHTALPISRILELEPGSVLELDREVSQPVDLLVCGTVFARGEVVVIDGRFAVRVKEVLNPRPQKGNGKP
ncbi:MAG: flagellar motor switch protein FliN [Gemmataceae bacterium]|nr:flagellar motor switch protein FliN [Gemmataceae bacterium]